MAQIYPKSGAFATAPNGTDMTLILDSRQALQYPFDFTGSFIGSPTSSAWTEIRLGMYFSIVSTSSAAMPTSSNISSSNNHAASNETLTIGGPADYFTFGIKDSQSTILPGVSGSYFVGIGCYTTGSAVVKSGGIIGNGGTSFMQTMGWNGSYLYTGSIASSTDTFNYPSDPSVSGSGYCGYYALRLVLNNSGSASQSFSVWTSEISPAPTYVYTPYQLIQDMGSMVNINYSSQIIVQWNSSSVALPLPDSYWFRSPLYASRFRFSAIAAKRYT